MTHAAKYRQNHHLLLLLDAYLQECGNYGERLRIIDEMARLRAQNRTIEKMDRHGRNLQMDVRLVLLHSKSVEIRINP